MLPSFEELRELSQRFSEAIEKAPTIQLRRRIAYHAFALAQVADEIEWGSSTHTVVDRANLVRYERLLAEALDEKTRATVVTLLSEEQKAIAKKRNEIKRWRMRADELRATAEQFATPFAQESLHRAAATYEQMADHAEALLTDKRAPGEKTG